MENVEGGNGEKVPLVLRANSSAVESIGQTKDEAQFHADAARIEGQEGHTVVEAAKKGEKKAGASLDKESYSIYIYKVLKQVHPDTGITSKAMLIMNSFVNGVFERIAGESSKLAKYNSKATISSREIQTAVRLLLPGELAKFAVSEGTKAITKYTSNPNPDPITFAQALFKQQLKRRRRLPGVAIPGVFRTLAGDEFTIPFGPFVCAATVGELQRCAWTAGARALEAEPDEVYFVNPKDPVALYRPTITVKVRQAGEGDPAQAAVEVQLATERGPLDGETEPTTVHYALNKICKTIGLGALDDKAIRGYRVVVRGAHAASVTVSDNLQRPLCSVGIVDGSELRLVDCRQGDDQGADATTADATATAEAAGNDVQQQGEGADFGQGDDELADATTSETPPLGAKTAGTVPVAAVREDDGDMEGSGGAIGELDLILQPSQHNPSRTSRAGLQFPVGRVHRHLRDGKYGGRVASGAPVYLAAVLEYIAAEILQLAGNTARDNKKSHISPYHLQLAVRNDEELNKLVGGVTIAQGGVLPNIHAILLPKKAAATAAEK